MRRILQKEEEAEEESLISKEESYGDRDQNDGALEEADSTFPANRYTQVRLGASLSYVVGQAYNNSLQAVWFSTA